MMKYISAMFVLLGCIGGAHADDICSWDKPGANRFTGSLSSAIDSYKDIPSDTRSKLVDAINSHQYSDTVLITRDAIISEKKIAEYEPGISQMHFGAGKVCKSVTRNKWKQSAKQRGLVYCADGECILVPSICGNVSRIKRQGSAAGGGGVSAFTPRPSYALPPEGANSVFGPVSAGSSSPSTPVSDSFVVPRTGSYNENAQPLNNQASAYPPFINWANTPYSPINAGGGGCCWYPGIPPVAPPVPEPETYAMIAAGFCVLGIVSRRKKKQNEKR